MRWDARYPDPDELKREIGHMETAIMESLLEMLPEGSVLGIYSKGSAAKCWETPIDYVPEISDLDLHVSLADESLIDRYFKTLGRTIHLQKSMESRYFSLKCDPIHVPRPQVLFLNDLEKMEDYRPSPRSSVKVLYGEEYAEADYSDVHRIKAFIAKDAEQHRAFMENYPHQIFDKLGRYNFQSLRLINWRIGPIGPKMLILHGLPIEESWTLNRTEIVDRLRDIGLDAFADAYRDYYLAGWDYFLSNWRDGDAARRAIENGASVVEGFLDVVADWKSACLPFPSI